MAYPIKGGPGRFSRRGLRLPPALAGVGAPEMATLVIYDVEEDKARLKVSEACLDFGLERIQYSAFCGRLNRNRRDELRMRLEGIMHREEANGRILIQPVCDRDRRECWNQEFEAAAAAQDVNTGGT